MLFINLSGCEVHESGSDFSGGVHQRGFRLQDLHTKGNRGPSSLDIFRVSCASIKGSFKWSAYYVSCSIAGFCLEVPDHNTKETTHLAISERFEAGGVQLEDL
jgi:hypothetical protein